MMNSCALVTPEIIFWQCISLVDHYAPLFFLELSTITPEQLCEKANLCGDTELVNLPKSSDFCTLCHNIVKEILTKLEDPDTQVLKSFASPGSRFLYNIFDHIFPLNHELFLYQVGV